MGAKSKKGEKKHQWVLHSRKLLSTFGATVCYCITTDGGLAKPLHKLLRESLHQVLALFSVIFLFGFCRL